MESVKQIKKRLKNVLDIYITDDVTIENIIGLEYFIEEIKIKEDERVLIIIFNDAFIIGKNKFKKNKFMEIYIRDEFNEFKVRDKLKEEINNKLEYRYYLNVKKLTNLVYESMVNAMANQKYKTVFNLDDINYE